MVLFRFLLIEKNDPEQCRRELRRLRGERADIEAEMAEIMAEERKQKAEPKRTLKDFFIIPYVLTHFSSFFCSFVLWCLGICDAL